MYELIAAGVSVLAAVIMALVAWGTRGERKAVRAEIQLARNEVQLLRSEMKTELAQSENRFHQQITEVHLVRSEIQTELAQAENRFYQRVNGNYVRKEVHADMVARVDRIESKVEELE